jgi:hypothetical protein
MLLSNGDPLEDMPPKRGTGMLLAPFMDSPLLLGLICTAEASAAKRHTGQVRESEMVGVLRVA